MPVCGGVHEGLGAITGLDNGGILLARTLLIDPEMNGLLPDHGDGEPYIRVQAGDFLIHLLAAQRQQLLLRLLPLGRVGNTRLIEIFVGEPDDLRTPAHFFRKFDSARNRHLTIVGTIGDDQHQCHGEPPPLASVLMVGSYQKYRVRPATDKAALMRRPFFRSSRREIPPGRFRSSA